MASESTAGGLSGAAQGAMAGAALGPVGIIAGAVIGGIIGAVGGRKKKEARRFAAKAAAVRRKQQQMRLALQRRDIVRQMRFAAAQAAVEGATESGVSSSAVMGAASSISAQGRGALQYFDSQVGLDNLYQTYAKRAGKAAGEAAEFGELQQALGSFLQLGGDLAGRLKQQQAGTDTASGFSSFNTTAAVSNMQTNSAFSTFGSTLNLGNP